MQLERYINDVYRIERDVKPSTIDHYQYTVKSYLQFNPGVKISGLCRDSVNRWLAALQDEGLSSFTIRQRRASLLSLWRAAYESGLIDEPPRGIRKIKCGDLAITVLDGDAILSLYADIEKLRGYMPNCGWRRADYFRTLTRATLETAMRQSDLHCLEMEDVRNLQGRLTIIQVKTGFRRRVIFSRELLDDIYKHHPRGCMVWPQGRREYVGRVYQRLGVTHTTLRKTAITRQEAKQVGTGWILAGHRSPETTRRWYTDHEKAYDELFD